MCFCSIEQSGEFLGDLQKSRILDNVEGIVQLGPIHHVVFNLTLSPSEAASISDRQLDELGEEVWIRDANANELLGGAFLKDDLVVVLDGDGGANDCDVLRAAELLGIVERDSGRGLAHVIFCCDGNLTVSVGLEGGH